MPGKGPRRVHVLKSLLKGGSALLLVAGLGVRFAPPTEAEIAALGPEPARTDLMMMRMAWTAMRIAPDATVAVYASSTGLPEDDMRRLLTALAEGTPLRTAALAGPGAEPPPAPDGRRTEAGGALFVTAAPRD